MKRYHPRIDIGSGVYQDAELHEHPNGCAVRYEDVKINEEELKTAKNKITLLNAKVIRLNERLSKIEEKWHSEKENSSNLRMETYSLNDEIYRLEMIIKLHESGRYKSENKNKFITLNLELPALSTAAQARACGCHIPSSIPDCAVYKEVDGNMVFEWVKAEFEI